MVEHQEDGGGAQTASSSSSSSSSSLLWWCVGGLGDQTLDLKCVLRHDGPLRGEENLLQDAAVCVKRLSRDVAWVAWELSGEIDRRHAKPQLESPKYRMDWLLVRQEPVGGATSNLSKAKDCQSLEHKQGASSCRLRDSWCSVLKWIPSYQLNQLPHGLELVVDLRGVNSNDVTLRWQPPAAEEEAPSCCCVLDLRGVKQPTSSDIAMAQFTGRRDYGRFQLVQSFDGGDPAQMKRKWLPDGHLSIFVPFYRSTTTMPPTGE